MAIGYAFALFLVNLCVLKTSSHIQDWHKLLLQASACMSSAMLLRTILHKAYSIYLGLELGFRIDQEFRVQMLTSMQLPVRWTDEQFEQTSYPSGNDPFPPQTLLSETRCPLPVRKPQGPLRIIGSGGLFHEVQEAWSYMHHLHASFGSIRPHSWKQALSLFTGCVSHGLHLQGAVVRIHMPARGFL